MVHKEYWLNYLLDDNSILCTPKYSYNCEKIAFSYLAFSYLFTLNTSKKFVNDGIDLKFPLIFK
jgi:hypothetical protein